MTEKCNGVRAYNCPYGLFCKAEDYNEINTSNRFYVQKDIKDFLDKVPKERPLWINDYTIQICEPQLNEKDLKKLLNKIKSFEFNMVTQFTRKTNLKPDEIKDHIKNHASELLES
jgi:hypothetical protein